MTWLAEHMSPTALEGESYPHYGHNGGGVPSACSASNCGMTGYEACCACGGGSHNNTMGRTGPEAAGDYSEANWYSHRIIVFFNQRILFVRAKIAMSFWLKITFVRNL